jgi:hypothetical protein
MMAELLRAPPKEDDDLLADRPALGAARVARWRALCDSFPAPRDEIQAWAQRMAAQHKTPKLHVNSRPAEGYIVFVNWITALYVIRYGENEAYWPAALSDQDVGRALAWERGKIPANVQMPA